MQLSPTADFDQYYDSENVSTTAIVSAVIIPCSLLLGASVTCTVIVIFLKLRRKDNYKRLINEG